MSTFAFNAYGVLVTSKASHGILKSVRTDSAREMDGVLGIWTGADLKAAGRRPVVPEIDLPLGDATPVRLQVRHWLATERVRYTGEPVALVVAETVAEARAAAQAVSVDIMPLPIIPYPRSAAALDALPLFDNASDNMCGHYRCGDYIRTVRAFDEAAHIARLRFVGDRADNTAMRNHDALAAFVARELGRRVQLDDDISTASLACAYDFEGELALSGDGTFMALRYKGFVSVGAYLEDMTPLNGAFSITCNNASPYRIPLVAVSSKALFTTTPPANAQSTAGKPDGFYFLERLIDQAARDLDIDPVELRKQNAPDLAARFGKACDAADAEGVLSRKASSRRNGTLRGLGIGTFQDAGAPAMSVGVEIAEVEIDAETGLIRVMQRTVVNGSNVVSHPAVRGNIQGIGDTGDARAKPALANAIVDALGGRHIDVPAIPERLWEALHAPAPMLGLY
jgi:CO/xanthine dehydrogenase Mo-binding subunit